MFFSDGPFPASFSLFLSFLLLIVLLVDKILPMLGFQPRISGVGCNLSANQANTTALNFLSLFLMEKVPKLSKS